MLWKMYFFVIIFRYLKDHDNYQRMLVDQERQRRPKNLKRVRSNSGCLCFSSKSRKDMSFDNWSKNSLIFHISYFESDFKGLLLSSLWIFIVNLQNRKNSSIRMACSIWLPLPKLIDSLLDVRQNVSLGVFAYRVTGILSCRNSGWKSLNIP